MGTPDNECVYQGFPRQTGMYDKLHFESLCRSRFVLMDKTCQDQLRRKLQFENISDNQG